MNRKLILTAVVGGILSGVILLLLHSVIVFSFTGLLIILLHVVVLIALIIGVLSIAYAHSPLNHKKAFITGLVSSTLSLSVFTGYWIVYDFLIANDWSIDGSIFIVLLGIIAISAACSALAALFFRKKRVRSSNTPLDNFDAIDH